MSPDNFYSELPSFSDFHKVGDLDDYRPVPDDWYVLAADIVSSSKAVSDGRYKDVNMVGAAVIAAVVNRLGRDRVPFVFGGDGAMLVVPSSDVEVGSRALAGVADLARSVMELDLRAAAIPVARIRELGGDIRLRKYLLSPGNHLAMILGDGLEIADRILKDEEAVRPYAIAFDDEPLPPLEGLSCRWEPLPAVHGNIVSLIVKPSEGRTLPEITKQIAAGIGFNPLQEDSRAMLADKNRLRFRFPPSGLSQEVRMAFAAAPARGWATTLFECLVFLFAQTTGRKVGPLDPTRYFRELGLNTDHRKVGDSLQLVLDLTDAQLDALRKSLSDGYEDGALVYGLHVSSEALMTCFVEDIANSRHIHFVDGSNGGMSAAAAEFKKRLAALAGTGSEVTGPA
ncbi:DUF3095 domain-containing protein [Rhodobacterales bacterium]|nr:DUF3095 domain-containing protein [Rhodobacterales bacterium]